MLPCCDRAVAIRCALPFQDHESRSLKCLRGPKTTKTAKLKPFNMTTNFWNFLVMHTEYTYLIYITWKSWPNSWIFLIVYVESYVLRGYRCFFRGLRQPTYNGSFDDLLEADDLARQPSGICVQVWSEWRYVEWWVGWMWRSDGCEDCIIIW